MAEVFRLRAEAEAECPRGTKLVVVPQKPGRGLRLLVPEAVERVVVILDDEGRIGWVEDSETGRGIVDFVKPFPGQTALWSG